MTAARRIAVLSAAAGSAVFACAIVAIRPVFGDHFRSPKAALAYAFAVAFLGAAAAYLGLAKGGRALHAAGLGAASGATGVMFAVAHYERGVDDAQLVVLASFLGVAAVIGAIFGLVSLVAFLPAVDVERAPSLDDVDRVLLPASIYLALVGAITVLGHGQRFVPGLLAIAAGVAAPAFVVARDVCRIRFLRAAFRGRAPEWAILANDLAARSPPLFTRYEDEAQDGALVRRHPGPHGGDEPIARLPLDAREAVAPLLARSVIVLITAIAAACTLAYALTAHAEWLW